MKRFIVKGLEFLLLGLIRGYQLSLSYFMGRQCRFYPTCSDYAKEAIKTHGLWLGGQLMVRRILRCRPGGGMGFDPVPDSLSCEAEHSTGGCHSEPCALQIKRKI